MENRLPASRPPTGRLLPPLVTVSAPATASGAKVPGGGGSFDKALRNIGQEQTYSRRRMENERQQVRARYERLKKKASQIRSNLTAEQIAELKGMERATSSAGTVAETDNAANKMELRRHSARLVAQRDRKISLELATANAKQSGASQKPPKSLRAEPAILAPPAFSMGQKRVRKSAATAATPNAKSKEDATLTAIGAKRLGVTKKKPVENLMKSDRPTMPPRGVSRPIPVPRSRTSGDLSTRDKREGTFSCGPNTTEEPRSIAEILSRPRASSALGRLETVPASSPTRLPTVPEEVHKVYTPVITRKFPTPNPPARPARSCVCAPIPTQISSEHRLAPINQATRFGRKVSGASPSSARPASRRKSSNVSASPGPGPGSVTVRPLGPAASVEPPAAFSCHEPKLEDILSRSYPTKSPADIRRISTAVSPFQVSRARRLEELRESRLDDNELLAVELEQRKEKLMQDIAGRPQEDEKQESRRWSRQEDVPASTAELRTGKGVDCDSSRAMVEIEDEAPGAAWHQDMMKIRYLRLPKDYEEVITNDMLTLATARHKAVSNLRSMDGI